MVANKLAFSMLSSTQVKTAPFAFLFLRLVVSAERRQTNARALIGTHLRVPSRRLNCCRLGCESEEWKQN